jgi:hypothetical protein
VRQVRFKFDILGKILGKAALSTRGHGDTEEQSRTNVVVLESSPVPEIEISTTRPPNVFSAVPPCLRVEKAGTNEQLTGHALTRLQNKTPLLLKEERGGTPWKAHRHRSLPRGSAGGANEEVSWLRASVRLPGFPVASERNLCPLQWRGRAGVTPASEHPGSRYVKARYPRLDQESNGKPSLRKVSVPSAAFGETTERNCFCGLGIKLPCCALPRISNKTTKLFLSCSRCLRVSPPILVVTGQQPQPEGSPAF